MQAAASRLRRAAEGGGDLRVGQIAGVAQLDRRPLFGRQPADQGPELPIGLGVFDRNLDDLGDRDRPASPGAVVVNRLAVGDRQKPAAQVGRRLQLGVGAQGGDEGLLEAILGVKAPDGAAQHSHHGGGVFVEQGLEGGQLGQGVD